MYLPLSAPVPTASLCDALRDGTALLFLRQLRQLEWHDHTSGDSSKCHETHRGKRSVSPTREVQV